MIHYKNIHISIISLFLLTEIAAQPGNGKISGKVMDAGAHQITGATITLNVEGDSIGSLVAFTNGLGKFHFSGLKKGTYSVNVQSLGYNPYSIRQLIIPDSLNSLALPPIILLKVDTRVLEKVTVSAKRPSIEHKIDRIIVNVDAMISSAGSNAMDVFEKSPGIIVDPNGNISMNGKNNVWVLIDDHPVYMTGQELAAYLRSLPAGTIDKLELISNPPARYDAAGNAIINIVLKKNTAGGFNGAVNVGFNQGVYGRSNNALNINFRKKKFNLFSNIGIGLDQNYSKGIYDRKFCTKDGSLLNTVSQNNYYSYHSHSLNSRLGIDYFLSPNTTVGIIASANIRGKTDLLQYHTTQIDWPQMDDSISTGTTAGKFPWKNPALNLNVQHQFDKKGQSMTVNFDYVNYAATGDQYATVNTYKQNNGGQDDQLRQFLTGSDIHIYAGKMDYTLPLKAHAFFDAGVKISHTLTNARSDWFDDIAGMHTQDYSKSNHFAYSELIAASYISYRKEFNRWTLQAGARLERTLANGHQYGNPVASDTSFEKGYTNIVPSLALQYKLDSSGHQNLTLAYSKRLRRPGYQQVNPFITFIDPYTYSKGNPGLFNSTAQYVELRYNYKNYFGITLSYGGGGNGINSLTQATGNIFITSPYNYINNTLYGLIPFVSIRPCSWWDFTLNATLLYQVNKGAAAGVTVDQHINVHEIETSHHFKWGTWTVEVNGFFPGKQGFGQTISGSIYNINFGVQKQVLRGNGTIRLNSNDIFHTMVMHSSTIGITNTQATNYKGTDSRWVALSFVYRFGKAANARKRNDTGSAEDEKSRTN